MTRLFARHRSAFSALDKAMLQQIRTACSSPIYNRSSRSTPTNLRSNPRPPGLAVRAFLTHLPSGQSFAEVKMRSAPPEHAMIVHDV